MELAPRGNLGTFLKDNRPLQGKQSPLINETRITQMAIDITSALKFLHAYNYVHHRVAAKYVSAIYRHFWSLKLPT
jgi:hypothetical protein